MNTIQKFKLAVNETKEEKKHTMTFVPERMHQQFELKCTVQLNLLLALISLTPEYLIRLKNCY